MALSSSSVLPSPETKSQFVRALFDRIAPRYDLLNRVLTLGMDQRWRRALIRWLELAPGARVLDLASGTGDLTELLQDAGARPIGADLAGGMLEQSKLRRPELQLAQCDGSKLPLRDASVDAVTCGFALRNFADLQGVLTECGRVLRPGGRIALLEVDRPSIPGVRQMHALYFRRVVPRIGAWLSDAEAYQYLPESTVFLPELEKMREILMRAGFVEVEKRGWMLGAIQGLRARRAP